MVQEIFELRADGTKIDHIIDILNHEGHTNINGKHFTTNSLQVVLRDVRYIGTNTYGELQFPNTIPAIVDVQLFNKVQKMFEANKRKPRIR